MLTPLTLPDLRSALQADPALAVQVWDQLRIAEAWDSSQGDWRRYSLVPEVDGEGREIPLVRIFQAEGRWHCRGVSYASIAEAREIEDERLKEQGWALVPFVVEW